ncbi:MULTISPECIES: hypothetical protein [Luteimonas]|uniref:hypothetical protein n=1 Tax=Luteimonas TaxID=83614 RepID=UPI000C7E60DE|nr:MULTISPECIES: hypothetical protein [Luteimonas]
MRAPFYVFLFGALAIGCPALAQAQALQERMTADQFRAAGLDKLDATELAELDAWFAAELASEVRHVGAHREGLQTDAPAKPEAGAVDSTIDGAFQGFARGRQYTLANGQVWRQLDDARLTGAQRVTHNPSVEIRPSLLGGWWLRVDGKNLRTRVERIK